MERSESSLPSIQRFVSSEFDVGRLLAIYRSWTPAREVSEFGVRQACRLQFLPFAAVLRLTHLLHPVDDLAVERFLNGDVRHRARWHCAVPMFFVRRKPDHVARPDFLDRSAFALRPSQTGCDDQGLTEWMRMPGSARTRLERDAGATNACRVGRLE